MYHPDDTSCINSLAAMSSGYSLIGALVASRRVMEQFLLPGASCWYGCIAELAGVATMSGLGWLGSS